MYALAVHGLSVFLASGVSGEQASSQIGRLIGQGATHFSLVLLIGGIILVGRFGADWIPALVGSAAIAAFGVIPATLPPDLGNALGTTLGSLFTGITFTMWAAAFGAVQIGLGRGATNVGVGSLALVAGLLLALVT